MSKGSIGDLLRADIEGFKRMVLQMGNSDKIVVIDDFEGRMEVLE